MPDLPLNTHDLRLSGNAHLPLNVGLGSHAKVRGVKQVLLTLALLGGAALAQTTTPTPTTPAPPTTTPATPAPATTAAPAATPAQDLTAVVGKVGTESYTLADFNRAFRLAVARVVNAQGVPFDEEYMSEFASVRPEYLKQFLRDRAVYQLARKDNQADAAALDKQMADARANFKTDDEFTQALKTTGYASADELRTEMERQMIVGAYLKGIQDRFKFGDALVAGYYTLHKDKFNRDAQACVKHILVKTQPEAQAIVKSLQGGADFAQVAKDKSLDPGSGAQGGDLGCFGRGEMVESFDKASFSGPVNELQTVQSQFGWHVLMVTKRNEAGLLPLEEAAPLIREQLGREAAQKYLDIQVQKLSTESFPDVVTIPEVKK